MHEVIERTVKIFCPLYDKVRDFRPCTNYERAYA